MFKLYDRRIPITDTAAVKDENEQLIDQLGTNCLQLHYSEAATYIRSKLRVDARCRTETDVVAVDCWPGQGQGRCDGGYIQGRRSLRIIGGT